MVVEGHMVVCKFNSELVMLQWFSCVVMYATSPIDPPPSGLLISQEVGGVHCTIPYLALSWAH